MTYFEGFVVAVPTANKEEYHHHARTASALFGELGVARMVEPRGFHRGGESQAGLDQSGGSRSGSRAEMAWCWSSPRNT